MFILICEEFPSHSGGVAYFSDVLAKKYHKEGTLRGVISLSRHPPEPRPFNVTHLVLPSRKYGSWPLDRIQLIKKFNTLIYKIYSFFIGSGVQWKPLKKEIDSMGYDPAEDTLFFTYQVHFPYLFNQIYRCYGGKQWMLYHGLELLNNKNKKRRILENCKVSEKVIFNSKATKDLFYNLGFYTDDSEIIYPFLDVDYLENLQLYTLKELEQIIGVNIAGLKIFSSVCRLVKRKGIHFAISIFEKVTKRYPDSIYLIIGKGPELARLKKVVINGGLETKIHFLGHVEDKLKYSILKYGSVFLMPNYDVEGSDFEGYGISFIEAAYYNNLVIGGKHGGSGEALKSISKSISIDPLAKEDINRASDVIIRELRTEAPH